MSDDIDIGQIGEALNHKADLDLNNTNPFADYVIEWEAASLANNYRWYRLYKSGWLEQGGNNIASTTGAITITFLKHFKDTTYTLTSSILHNATPVDLTNAQAVGGKTVSSFQYFCKAATDTGYNISWEAKGFAEE